MKSKLLKWGAWAVGMAGIILVSAVPAGALASGPGGNASGGRLATVAAKQSLTGPKGSGLKRGITGSSVTVGCVYTAADYAGFQDGLEARIDRANRSGGIDGRKLKLLPCKDDGSNVQTDVQDVEQVVNQNNAFALFSLTESILPGSTDFLSQNQVPYYGWGFNPGFCGTRWGFGWNGCVSPNLLASSNPLRNVESGNLAEAILKATGMKASKVRFAGQADNSPAGLSANAGYAKLFSSLGAKVVYNQANFPDNSSPDYTPYVQAILAADPNVVYITTPFANIAGFVASLKAAGYKGITLDFATYVPGLLAESAQLASALQGEYINTQVVPQEQDTAFVKQEFKDFTAADLATNLTLGASIGYYEAEEFIEQLQAVGKNLNTKTFDAKVNGGSFVSYANLPAGGPGELKWPAAHFLPSDCAAIVRVSGTKYNVVKGFQCYQSFNLSG